MSILALLPIFAIILASDIVNSLAVTSEGLYFLSQLTESNGGSSTQANVGCMIRRCGLQLAKCSMNAKCRQCTQCMQKCNPSDALCQSMCFFRFSEKYFNGLVGCAIKNKCIGKMTWSNYSCPKKELEDGSVKRIQSFDVKTFAKHKQLFVARGSHPIYDCFECQHLNFTLQSDGGVRTHWSTDLEGDVRGASYTLYQDGPNSIKTKYDLFGMPVEEHYYIMDYTDDYILYFYCGYGFGGEYQGSLVYSTSRDLQKISPEIDQRFEQKMLGSPVLRKYLPEWDEYCVPNYDRKCANI